MTEGFALHEIICDASERPTDYRFLDLNPAFEQLTGLKRADVVGKTVLEVLPETEPVWIEQYGQVALTGQSIHFDRYFPPLGKHYEVFAYRPAPSQFAVLVRDITERKRAEEEIRTLFRTVREEKDRLSSLLRSITDEVWFADVDGRFTLANPAAGRAFDLADVDNLDVEKFAASLEVCRPDGTPRPAEEAPPLRALRGEIVTNQDEIIRTPATGKLRHRQVSSAPVRNAAGDIIGSVSVVRDITDLKRAEDSLRESEANYRELVQNANSAIIRWKSDGTITFFNEYAQSFFGYSAAEAVGRPVSMLIPEVDSTGGDLRALAREIVSHPERYVQNINENVCRDGRRVWMAWTNNAVLDENGKVAEILAVATDITDRKEAEEALQQANASLDRQVQNRTAELAQRAVQLRALAAELTLSEQRERRRMAKVLHDHLQQLLVAAKFHIGPPGAGCRPVADGGHDGDRRTAERVAAHVTVADGRAEPPGPA